MAEVASSTKLIGRFGSLCCGLGFIIFLSGLFFLPRMFTFLGIGLLVLSLILFWIEESGKRRLERANSTH